MTFSVLSPEEVRAKYEAAADKEHMIGVLADFTCSTKNEMRAFLGLPVKEKPAGPIKLDRAEAQKLYEQGMTDPEIAQQFNVSPETVRHWRKINALPANKRKQVIHDERMELYRMGKSDREIADAVHVAVSSIFKWRKINGLPSNWKPGYPKVYEKRRKEKK